MKVRVEIYTATWAGYVTGLFGILAAELVLVRRGVDLPTVVRVGKIDLWYGVLAGLIVLQVVVRAR